MSLDFLKNLLEKQQYLIVATADENAVPNAAPMFFVHVEARKLYLVDYTLGKTYNNLKANPKVSISVSDLESLTGFKISGTVDILTEGPVCKKIYEQFEQRAVDLSVQRVIDGIHKNKKHKDFEAGVPRTVVIYQIHVSELIQITAQGAVERKF